MYRTCVGKQYPAAALGTEGHTKKQALPFHPTQKPEYLLERIVLASTKAGQTVLDPFCGSGTTGVAARRFERQFIGIDNCEEYLEITKRRLEKVLAERRN